MLKIGSHVSFSDTGLLNAAKEAESYGSSTFMVYTGAPQNTRRRPIDALYIPEGKEAMAKSGVEEIVVHAPYIVNLGSYKESTYELAVSFLQEEIRRTHQMGVKQIVLHPGAFTDMDAAYGIDRIAAGLNEVLSGTMETDVQIALETMAGKGTEIGRSFEELAAIMDKVEHSDRLTVCMDTCHMHDAGYNLVEDLDGVLHQFDKLVGLNKVAVVHLNDSKNPMGAGKDRHTPIGSGYIGFPLFAQITQNEALRHLPFILETPWIGKDAKTQRPMYEVEIALLRGNVEERMGAAFIEDVERLQAYFADKGMDRAYVLSVWELLKSDAKARKADPREPMERLYDMVLADKALSAELTEEQVNQRITAWFAGEAVYS